MAVYYAEIQSIDKIYEAYELSSASLWGVVSRIIPSGPGTFVNLADFPSLTAYSYYPKNDLEDIFEFALIELDRNAILNMLIAVENFMQRDFNLRYPIRYASLRGTKGWVGLVQIITEWENVAPTAIVSILNNLRDVLKLRHWLAHGRHWNANVAQFYSPQDILILGKQAIAEISLLVI